MPPNKGSLSFYHGAKWGMRGAGGDKKCGPKEQHRESTVLLRLVGTRLGEKRSNDSMARVQDQGRTVRGGRWWELDCCGRR